MQATHRSYHPHPSSCHEPYWHHLPYIYAAPYIIHHLSGYTCVILPLILPTLNQPTSNTSQPIKQELGYGGGALSITIMTSMQRIHPVEVPAHLCQFQPISCICPHVCLFWARPLIHDNIHLQSSLLGLLITGTPKPFGYHFQVTHACATWRHSGNRWPQKFGRPINVRPITIGHRRPSIYAHDTRAANRDMSPQQDLMICTAAL